MSPAGRPEIGAPINIRLGDELLKQVDAYAETEQVARAEAIRQLVQHGLRRSELGPPRECSCSDLGRDEYCDRHGGI